MEESIIQTEQTPIIPQEIPKPKKRYLLPIILGIIILVLVSFIIFQQQKIKNTNTEKPINIFPTPTQITVIEPTKTIENNTVDSNQPFLTDKDIFTAAQQLYASDNNLEKINDKTSRVIYWPDQKTGKSFWESPSLTKPLDFDFEIRLKLPESVDKNNVYSISINSDGYKSEVMSEVNKLINLFRKGGFSYQEITKHCFTDHNFLLNRQKTTCLIGVNYLNTSIPGFQISCANQDHIDQVISEEKTLAIDILNNVPLDFQEFQLGLSPSDIRKLGINDDYALFNVGGTCSLEQILFQKIDGKWNKRLEYTDAPKCQDLITLKIPQRIFSVCLDKNGREQPIH